MRSVRDSTQVVGSVIEQFNRERQTIGRSLAAYTHSVSIAAHFSFLVIALVRVFKEQRAICGPYTFSQSLG